MDWACSWLTSNLAASLGTIDSLSCRWREAQQRCHCVSEQVGISSSGSSFTTENQRAKGGGAAATCSTSPLSFIVFISPTAPHAPSDSSDGQESLTFPLSLCPHWEDVSSCATAVAVCGLVLYGPVRRPECFVLPVNSTCYLKLVFTIIYPLCLSRMASCRNSRVHGSGDVRGAL